MKLTPSSWKKLIISQYVQAYRVFRLHLAHVRTSMPGKAFKPDILTFPLCFHLEVPALHSPAWFHSQAATASSLEPLESINELTLKDPYQHQYGWKSCFYLHGATSTGASSKLTPHTLCSSFTCCCRRFCNYLQVTINDAQFWSRAHADLALFLLFSSSSSSSSHPSSKLRLQRRSAPAPAPAAAPVSTSHTAGRSDSCCIQGVLFLACSPSSSSSSSLFLSAGPCSPADLLLHLSVRRSSPGWSRFTCLSCSVTPPGNKTSTAPPHLAQKSPYPLHNIPQPVFNTPHHSLNTPL